MEEVECEIVFGTAVNDDGRVVECIKAICSRCGHATMSWGDGLPSKKRCLAMMHEECPEAENNFYVEE
jgi:hypothetical protein